MIATARLQTLLREHWDAVSPGVRFPGRFSFLVVTKGRDAVGKVVLLAFADQERTPRFVIKLARLKDHDRALDAEYRNLAMIAPHATRGRVSTPRALFRGQVDGRLCVIESIVDGVELVHAHPSTTAAALTAIVDWLIHLGRVTAHRVDDDDLAASVATVASYVTTTEERRVLDNAEERIRSLRGQPVPRVFEHRDLGTWNVVLASDGALGVLDWESFRPDGLPAADLVYFLAHYGFMLERPHGIPGLLASVRDTFLDVCGFGTTASAAVRRYAEAMELHEAWLRPLFVGCWLQHAASDVSRRRIALSESLFWQILVMTLARDGQPAPVATRS